MSYRNQKENTERNNYRKDLKKARDNFLDVFYGRKDYDRKPNNSDLLSFVIIQNLEILDLLRNGSKGGD